MKKIILSCFTLILFAGIAKAQTNEIFAPDGKAIRGYDPVAFYKEQKPVKGIDSLAYTWKNATWFFSSAANLDSFKANPGRYAPQYGGYCAYGTSEGHKAPTETDTWTIVDDKLYFNYNTKVKERWTKNQQELIEKANAQWPLIKDKQ
ncbi:YHS domain-containing (seleno)protein [Foetidibacter luteolus]|uniref:YHS domain-containing (seleno)protein n=1 Tax=Foetidibacter luteolus TaxID=2608880 RepID=UPI00129A48BC|nr:YHS domain-containing (seleno)protein [Foetidibacter luteolus]